MLFSSCNDLVHCSSEKRDLGTTNKQSNMAAVEPVDELKECLRASVCFAVEKDYQTETEKIVKGSDLF